VLSVLANRESEKVADIVVRSDGGTELGVAASSGVHASSERRDGRRRGRRAPAVSITVAADSGTVRGILESVGVEFDAADEAPVTVDVTVPVADADRLLDRVRRDRRPGDGGVGASAGRLTFRQERNRKNAPGST